MFGELSLRHHRRDPRARRHQARRPAGARPRAAGALAPAARRVGLSATVGASRRRCAPGWRPGARAPVDDAWCSAAPAPSPRSRSCCRRARCPGPATWACMRCRRSTPRSGRPGTTLVFVNTRAQAELVFQALWRLNDDNLPIALHHGSLAVEQRRKVEAAMAAGKLRAVVAPRRSTSASTGATVDLVIQVGAPKGVSRLLQRIGRANHRLDEPSRAMLVPANRFEVLECRAAIEAIARARAGRRAAAAGRRSTCWPSTSSAWPAPARSTPMTLYAEVRARRALCRPAAPGLRRRARFRRDGGYALGVLRPLPRLFQRRRRPLARAAPRVAPQLPHEHRHHRRRTPMLQRAAAARGAGAGRGRGVFRAGPGAGRHLHLRRPACCASRACARRWRDGQPRASGDEPKVPAYAGGRLPLTTHLAARVRGDPARPETLARAARARCATGCGCSAGARVLPRRDGLLVETFPRGGTALPGRLLLRGPQRAPDAGHAADAAHGARWVSGRSASSPPTTCSAIWSLRSERDRRRTRCSTRTCWATTSRTGWPNPSLLKRTFRNVAIIAGLIERRQPGQEKTGPPDDLQLRPDLRRAAQARARPHAAARDPRRCRGRLTDVRRLAEMLARVKGRIRHRRARPRLAAGRAGADRDRHAKGRRRRAIDALLAEAAAELIAEATREDAPKQDLLL